MQYYIYNDNAGQNEYQKIFVDGILAEDRQITIGKLLFEIFTTFSELSPVGALPLNGYEIEKCNEKLPWFWRECRRRKANGTIPVVNSRTEWNNLSGTQNGNVGAFWIDEPNGFVKLPCLSTVVLTNSTSINNIHDTLGIYTSGIIGKHLHANTVSLSIKENNTDDEVNLITDTNTIIDVSATSAIAYKTWDNDSTKIHYLSDITTGMTEINSSYTITHSITNKSAGLNENIPANIKVYYWIQVFTSYITQDLSGKLAVVMSGQNILQNTIQDISAQITLINSSMILYNNEITTIINDITAISSSITNINTIEAGLHIRIDKTDGISTINAINYVLLVSGDNFIFVEELPKENDEENLTAKKYKISLALDILGKNGILATITGNTYTISYTGAGYNNYNGPFKLVNNSGEYKIVNGTGALTSKAFVNGILFLLALTVVSAGEIYLKMDIGNKTILVVNVFGVDTTTTVYHYIGSISSEGVIRQLWQGGVIYRTIATGGGTTRRNYPAEPV